jgi:hypothetical protein
MSVMGMFRQSSAGGDHGNQQEDREKPTSGDYGGYKERRSEATLTKITWIRNGRCHCTKARSVKQTYHGGVQMRREKAFDGLQVSADPEEKHGYNCTR